MIFDSNMFLKFYVNCSVCELHKHIVFVVIICIVILTFTIYLNTAGKHQRPINFTYCIIFMQHMIRITYNCDNLYRLVVHEKE